MAARPANENKLIIHLSNGARITITDKVDTMITRLRWSIRSGEALEWVKSPEEIVMINPTHIVAYTIIRRTDEQQRAS